MATMTTSMLASPPKEEVHSSSLSLRSESTLCTLADACFQPSRILTINAQGIGAFRLPIPSRQTEIFIYNPDGTEAYISTRAKTSSGDAVLSNPKRGNLIRTEYFFGPNRDPVLHCLQTPELSDLTVSGKWTSRTMQFDFAGRQFEWKYAKEKRADGQKVNLIIFHAVDAAKDQTNRIAQLSRGADTRTPGTSKCAAGNGGELQIDEAALQYHELDEAVVVATCLMMLKKEIDRRRMMQFAVIAGVVGN